MAEDDNEQQRPDRAYEEVIREDVGVRDGVDNAMWGWLNSDKEFSKTLDYTDDSKVGTYPTTEEVERKKAGRRRYLNSEGAFFKEVNFDGVTDAGLVWMIADEFDDIPSVPRRAASAELDRRHAAAMKSSSTASYWLAFAVFVVALVQVILLVYQVWGPNN